MRDNVKFWFKYCASCFTVEGHAACAAHLCRKYAEDEILINIFVLYFLCFVFLTGVHGETSQAGKPP